MLSNAWCTQQESDLYKCQVEVATSSLLALITVTYDVGGVPSLPPTPRSSSVQPTSSPTSLNPSLTPTSSPTSLPRSGTLATSSAGALCGPNPATPCSLPIPPLPFTYSTPHPIKCAATNSYPLSTGLSPTKSCSFSTRHFPTLSRAGALAYSSSLPCSSLPISTEASAYSPKNASPPPHEKATPPPKKSSLLTLREN
ncbi:hypothetical protein ACKKBG_A05090 [Auxenochlorella protothecoides x Auxenochlorella symbiontica]